MAQSSFAEVLNDKVIPPVMAFVNLKPVQALKNGMLVIMPLTIIGSVFLLLAFFPVTAVADWFVAIGLRPLLDQAYASTFNLIGIIAAAAIAYNYVKWSGHEALSAAVIALCSFVLLMPPTVTDATSGATIGGVIDMAWTGSKGMIGAIVIGELVGFIYTWFLDKKIVINMPDGVPPAVANAFTALIPGFVIITLGTVVVGIFKAFGTTMMEAIYSAIQTPLQGLTDSVGGVLIMSFLIPFLWFFGIHGSSIVGGVMQALLQANTLDNQRILDSGQELTLANGGHIVTQQFLDQFINMTGAGVTIGIVIYMLVMAKSAQFKELGKLGTGPAFFNINEPITFGTPIVMNPLLAVPFIAVPMLTGLVQYFAIASGLTPLYSGIQVPWTTPPIISGFLIGGWRAALLQVVIIAMSVAIYFPFIRKVDQMTFQAEQEAHEEHMREAAHA